jgi:hypothetical protein
MFAEAPPNAQLSAAPLAGVEGEPAVGWLSTEQRASCRPAGCGKNVSTRRGSRALRPRPRPGYDRASGVGCTAWLGGSVYNLIELVALLAMLTFIKRKEFLVFSLK